MFMSVVNLIKCALLISILTFKYKYAYELCISNNNEISIVVFIGLLIILYFTMSIQSIIMFFALSCFIGCYCLEKINSSCILKSFKPLNKYKIVYFINQIIKFISDNLLLFLLPIHNFYNKKIIELIEYIFPKDSMVYSIIPMMSGLFVFFNGSNKSDDEIDCKSNEDSESESENENEIAKNDNIKK